jgi:Domain of unknown function (DUF4160)
LVASNVRDCPPNSPSRFSRPASTSKIATINTVGIVIAWMYVVWAALEAVAITLQNRLECGKAEQFMPVISMFYGIIVMMYYFDDKQHHLPHIHVEYADQSAVLAIPSGEVLKGSIRSSRLRLVQAWIEIHQ